MSEKVEPCWWCGGYAGVEANSDGDFVRCHRCGAAGPPVGVAQYEAAVTVWNNGPIRQGRAGYRSYSDAEAESSNG